jgi:hypothetical protein
MEATKHAVVFEIASALQAKPQALRLSLEQK